MIKANELSNTPDYKNQPGAFLPPWASAYGQDVFGYWADVLLNLNSQPEVVRQRFRWIPKGVFMMGSPESEAERFDDETLHRVTLSVGFWLADTACSQGLWRAVMGNNPSEFTLSDEHPVESISWQDTQKFMQRLNQHVPALNARLPTEAQWEYACRAGTTTAFNLGNNISSEQVNFNGDRPYAGAVKGEDRNQTVAVKELSQNAWGLFQMHGNVWEWCQDEWQPDLGSKAVIDPIAQAQDGDSEQTQRVLRGGSWHNRGGFCRSAIRLNNTAGYRLDPLGFRLALGHELQHSAGGASE